MRPLAISVLYDEYCDLYDALSDDREFNLEAEELVECCYTRLPLCLELMAGPGRHTMQLQNRGLLAHALDTSSRMKEFSIQQGIVPEDDYYLGDCVSELEHLPESYDLIFLTRFGLGYVSPDSLATFVESANKKLSKNGVIVLDVHPVSSAVSGFGELEIRTRMFKFQDNAYRCTWPLSMQWETASYKVSMIVRFENLVDGSQIDFVSEEYIHCPSTISAIGKLKGIDFKIHDSDSSRIRLIGCKQ